ncbi:ABC transporter, partial [Arthrobacter deserti]|nr:ABC transporter [Arthrobacter deserti]
MRKALTLIGTGIAAALALSACGGGDNASAPSAAATLGPANPTTVTVGASPVPHAKILEFVDQNLAK